MRLGVFDVGSNTFHLLVVDAHCGGQPLPASSFKTSLRLVELLDGDGALSDEGGKALLEAVSGARGHAEELGV